MSHSSRESSLAQYREALAQLNSEFFLLLSERRSVCLKIQELKDQSGRYSHYDPEREAALFGTLSSNLKELTVKELLAFSLIMEDQAMAMAPGSYPSWSNGCHLSQSNNELFEMINPLLLKLAHPLLYGRLNISTEFSFLKDF